MIHWKQLDEWQKDWLNVDVDALKKRREFLRRAPLRDQALFVDSLQVVRQGRRELMKDFAAIYAHQTGLDSAIASTPHMDRLLELAERHRDGGSPDPRRWFEALSLFDQALAIARIEYKDPLESVGRDLEVLLDFLWSTFFDDEYKRIHLHAYHDPTKQFIVTEDDVSIDEPLIRPGLIHRVYPLDCRRITSGGIAFMDDRIKGAFSTWLKIGRKMKDGIVTDTYNVTDRCGLTFVVPTRADLVEFALSLLDTLLKNGAEELEKLSEAGEDVAADPTNRSSSSMYRMAKMLVMWHEREYEFQFITFHDYFTAKRSLTDANHDLYKLRQACGFSFPYLWPTSIYGIEWEQEHVRNDLRAWKIDQLGWHVNGKHSVNL
ncbi:MAG: hypothetical protein NTX72_01680 [Candidatus Uhrbacteria bacterium]|nr:hypothetical protein [Candidatus Uhrbacteria bacterium]